MVLKPFSWHEVSIDTPAEEICQEMWEQLANGHTDRHTDRQTDGQTDSCFNNIDQPNISRKTLERAYEAIQNLVYVVNHKSFKLKDATG